MVAIAMYDTHAAIKRLESVGFSLSQAETIVAEHVKVMDEGDLATKQDIKNLQQATQQDIKDLRQEMHYEIGKLRQEMKDLEMRITIRLGAIMVALTGILFTALKLT